MRPGAVGTESDGTGVSGAAQFRFEFLESARGRIFLCGMVKLPAPSLVFTMIGKQSAGTGDDFEEEIDTDGEIRGIQEGCVRLGDFRTDLW